MHNWILKFLIAAMLFVSVESVAEFVDETSFHQTHHAHVSDASDEGNQWFPDSDGQDHEGDSCQHFCHAHVVALTTQISMPSISKLHHGVPPPGAHANNRAAAPPTPPPNI